LKSLLGLVLLELENQQKGGSTQSRLNLTNHHYKEPPLK